MQIQFLKRVSVNIDSVHNIKTTYILDSPVMYIVIILKSAGLIKFNRSHFLHPVPKHLFRYRGQDIIVIVIIVTFPVKNRGLKVHHIILKIGGDGILHFSINPIGNTAIR